MIPLVLFTVLVAVAPVSSAAWLHPVVLTRSRSLRPGLASYPRIARPLDEAQRRINAALDRLDARAGAAARECLHNAGRRGGGLERQVDTTMRGPEFISFLVADDADCGGNHPYASHSAIVYDLRSGRPVDWAALLPPRLLGTQALSEGADRVRMVTLTSPRLWALYRAGYDHGAPDPQENKECRDAVAAEGAGGPPPMRAWLDAERSGLALQFDMSPASEACSEPVVVPAAVLRREGASPRLLAAFVAARPGGGRREGRVCDEQRLRGPGTRRFWVPASSPQ